MADFVLVHGAWHGAWCWQRILPGLWRAGHRAFAVSLTGTGERAHQLAPDIRLADHIEDAAAVMEAEELQEAIVVGHSYGGLIITGLADRMPQRIARLVYVDAVVPLPGESWSSGHPESTRAQRRAAIAATGAIPPSDPALFGLSGDDANWISRRMRPQPGGVYDDPLHFDATRVAALPRSFIDCHAPALATIDPMRARVRAEPGWQVLEVATGHDPMISAPDALLHMLLAMAQH
ncbi:alpha/beta fold hydrolase [Noviherbaspirillum pedocola]|uniref:Alpha/beta fold hydrolase n=1 Tax=Noviherbaspirillum pedocola TaxID=2801341 RepID=A0A934SZB1_9BURK|nr:alpha/beta fold hydrolase [Noviherbaspirillum pedocola]MBK4735449.1 alpha/beta fold hydrolase [Noviherbaspirillum pedocola]